MRKLAESCEAIAATTKKLQKTAIVAEYFKSRTTDEAAVSAVFLSGRAFPAWEETTLQVGGSLLWRGGAQVVVTAVAGGVPSRAATVWCVGVVVGACWGSGSAWQERS